MTYAEKIALSIHEHIQDSLVNSKQKYGKMDIRTKDAREIGKILQEMGYQVEYDFYNNPTVIW